MLPVNEHARALKRERGCNSVHRSVRAAAFTLVAIGLASCAGTMQPAPPPAAMVVQEDPSAITRSALREIVLARKANLKAGTALSDPIVALYEIRDYRPAWTSDTQQDVVAQIRTVLAKASEQGLRANDYRLPPEAHPAPGREAAAYEIAISDSLLRYAHDVH